MKVDRCLIQNISFYLNFISFCLHALKEWVKRTACYIKYFASSKRAALNKFILDK